MRQLSLHVVGADFPNRHGGNRRFEILLCTPGEPVALQPEPKNPADPHAIAVFSTRGVQIGYLTAERAPWIGGILRAGRALKAIFQQPTAGGAAIRLAFDGEVPVLPAVSVPAPPSDTGFWPDDLPADD